MPTGDDALEAGMDVVDASTGLVKDGAEEFNRTRDYIAQFFRSAKTYADGLLTAAKAYTDTKVGAISLTWGAISDKPATYPPIEHGHPAQQITPGTGYFGGSGTYGFPGDVASNGSFYSFGRSPVSSGYVAAYFNSDGRLGNTPSAARFKKNIRPKVYTLTDAARLGALVVTYQLRAALFREDEPERTDPPTEYGVIAEALIEAGFPEFVAVDAEGLPYSVHYERLVLVIAAAMPELVARLEALEK